MDLADANVVVMPGDPTLLLDLLRGGPLGRFVDKKRDHLGGVAFGPEPSRLLFVWRGREVDEDFELPALIVGSEEQITDLLAWSAAYMKPVSPLTSLIRVETPETLRHLLQQKSTGTKFPERTIGALVGMVLAESTVGSGDLEGRSSAAGVYSLSTSFMLTHFVLAGMRPVDLEMVVREWIEARELVDADRGSFQIEQVLPIVRRIVEETTSNDFAQSTFGQVPDLFNERGNRLQGVLREISASPAEDRTRLFDFTAPMILSNETRDSAAFHLAQLAAACRPGDFSGLKLLAPYAADFPASMLWFGAMIGASGGTGILSAMDGLGWRVWRDASRRASPLERPTSDVSVRELRVLSRAKNGANLRRIARGASRNRLCVEMSGGVTAEFRVRRPNVEPNDRVVRVEVNRPTLTRSDDRADVVKAIARIERDLHLLREQISPTYSERQTSPKRSGGARKRPKNE